MLYVIWVFNRLVVLGVRADNAWSDIDVQLKRRWDLVPRLVEIVRGYAAHESRTLEDVVRARSEAQRPESPAARGAAESALQARSHRLIALAEAYPDLKADESFRSLHERLVEVEDALQAARRYYNAVVRDLNTLIAQFPSAMVASVFRRKPREFFELEDERESAAPEVRIS